MSVSASDFVCGHLVHGNNLELHFYAKDIDLADYRAVEREFTAAEHFGIEVGFELN